MNLQPSPATRSNAPVYAAVVGALLALIGAVQLIAALVYAAQLIESDLNGGLFGFRVGMLMVIVVCVPAALSGALSVAGGVGAAQQKRAGYVASIVASAIYVGASALAVLFALGTASIALGEVLAVVATVVALSATVIVVMLRAMAATR